MDETLTTTGAAGIPAAGEHTQTAAGGQTLDPAMEASDEHSAQGGRTAPISVVRSVRDELKTARDQAALYKRQLELSQERAAQDPFQGLSGEAPLTVAQARQVMQGQAARMEALASQLQFSMAHPGFAQTIKEHLPQMIEENPDLLDVIRHSPNPLAAAYSLARLSPSARSAGGADVGEQMRRIMVNAQKPGSASSASGGAGISAAGRIAKMTDAEFTAYKEQVKAGKIRIGG